MKSVSSWGRLSADLHHIVGLNNPSRINNLVSNGARLGVAHGMGRSYGDVCLNPGGTLWVTTGLDHFVAFDDSTGRLVCEAGVLLKDIQRLVIPRGWILPVTPGTQMVTVGGAIANDVHGKNHHMLGSFGNHVQSLTLARTDGNIFQCRPNEHSEWFAATVGGLGLTGVIIQAEIQLRRTAGPWLNIETVPCDSLEDHFHLAYDSESEWEYFASWIDCVSGDGGRGLFMRGNSANIGYRPPPPELKLTIPLSPPVSLVNQVLQGRFNLAYYYFKKWQARKTIAYYEPFLYPLDTILEWNRIYGPKGFFQYQSLVPREVGQDVIQAMLKEMSRCGEKSFFAVLKILGNQQPIGMLSFPQPGVTLALDFPNHGERTHKLFERLDAIVREAKGRLYPAKDARMPRELFEAGYPFLAEFMKFRDPGISSGLSRRLMGG